MPLMQEVEKELPTNQTLNNKINEMGYTLKKVIKVKPLKKIEQTDKIFENLKKVHDENKSKDNVVRISIDTKNRVKVGDFSRGGKSRIAIKAGDHDFAGDYLTQFVKRIIEFSATYNVKVILAYYSPYHSKYNPIERVWGRLEQHWNGDILDTNEAVLGFAKSMTWKGENPFVTLIETVYETDKKVEKKIMQIYETAMNRAEGIEKWFVMILPDKCKKVLNMELKV